MSYILYYSPTLERNRLPYKVFKISSGSTRCALYCFEPMAPLETSLEANYDNDGHRTDKATYRGMNYRSAQKSKQLEELR